MFIKEIKELDNFSGEADLVITDGINELMCYYHPAEAVILGDKVKEVTTLFAEDIMRIDRREYLIRKEIDHYSYHLCGKVIDEKTPKVLIGKLVIKLDKPLWKDIKVGDFIEFKVYRIDCYL